MKLLMLSDLHFSPYTEWGDFDEVILLARREEPQYIVIAGDIFNCISDFYADGVKAEAVRALTKLAEVAPVVAVVGNHDYAWEIKRGSKNYRDEELFATLRSIPNFHLLSNEWLRTAEVDFYGLEFDNDYYYPQENQRKLKRAVVKAGKEVERGKMSILLFHSPAVLGGIDTAFDLKISGHMHEGMVPVWARWLFPKGRGLVGPSKKILPKYARSIISKSGELKSKNIIVPAWETLPVRPRFFQIGKSVYRRKCYVVEVVEKSIVVVEKIIKNKH